MFVEVDYEVFLALELPGELLGVDVPEGAFLGLRRRIGVHLKIGSIIVMVIRQTLR